MLSAMALLPVYVETNCFMAALSHTVLVGDQRTGSAAGLAARGRGNTGIRLVSAVCGWPGQSSSIGSSQIVDSASFMRDSSGRLLPAEPKKGTALPGEWSRLHLIVTVGAS